MILSQTKAASRNLFPTAEAESFFSLARTQQLCNRTWASALKANNSAGKMEAERSWNGHVSHLNSFESFWLPHITESRLIYQGRCSHCRFQAASAHGPGINRVRFDGNDEIIEAMISVEGEVVELVNKAPGLEKMQRQVRSSSPDYP